MTPYNELLEGNKAFQNQYFKENEDKMLDLLENGQHPKALFITCSDSRVSPNIMTQTGPGDLFIARNIGNFVPPYAPAEAHHATASAIEYAVSALKVPNIIVCGHTHCGAMATLYTDAPGDEFIHVRKWLELGNAVKKEAQFVIAKEATHDELLRLTEKINVLTQMENLLTYPPVKKAVDAGDLQIHGWIYNMENGEVAHYDPEDNNFKIVEGEEK